MNLLAVVLLNRWSLIEAAAYAVATYASHTDWLPEMDHSYSEVGEGREMGGPRRAGGWGAEEAQ